MIQVHKTAVYRVLDIYGSHFSDDLAEFQHSEDITAVSAAGPLAENHVRFTEASHVSSHWDGGCWGCPRLIEAIRDEKPASRLPGESKRIVPQDLDATTTPFAPIRANYKCLELRLVLKAA